MPVLTSFGTWLRQKRRSLDLTQKAFADQIGCAEITVRRMEADEYKPSKELALVLFENLGIPELERPSWVQFARGLAEYPDDQASPSASRAPKTNLPIHLTSFIGREKEQEEIKKLILKNRLVTILGAGGIGKTRLSIQTGFALLNNFPNGIWWVELASLSDPTLVPQAIITTLGLTEQAGRSPLSILTDFLQSKRVLLILDNCEHLVQACAHLTESLLHSCPDLRILATSRETLGVDGETVYLVPSLTIPNPKQVNLEGLPDYEAVQLFLERGHSSRSDFMLTKENAHAIAQICHDLDGIPLAIELAAARVKVLSTEEIAMRLDNRFRLLTSGARTALPRHQTLRAMIDWSYDLLSEKEKLLLRRLAVFTGGWSLEFAEQVCSDNKIDSNEMLDMLAKLVDKSLVMVAHNKTSARYRILETIRQYAQERLSESDEDLTIRAKHRDVFLAFVETAAPEIFGADQKKWIDALEKEHDNIRSGMNWSIETQDAEHALRYCCGLAAFWERHKHYVEAATACKDTFALVDQIDGLKMTAQHATLLTACAFYIPASLLEIRPSLEQARSIYNAIDAYNSPGSTLTSEILTYVDISLNDLSAAEECLLDWYEKVNASGYRWGIALAKRTMAQLALAKGQPDSAVALWQQAYELFMEIGDGWAASEVSGALIWQKIIRGELEEAIRLSKQNLLFYEEYGDPGGVARSNLHLGTIAREQGQYESARRYFTGAIARATERGDQSRSMEGAEQIAYLDYLEGNPGAARAKYKAVLTALNARPDDDAYGFVSIRFAQISLRENQLEEARKALTVGLEILQKAAQNVDLFVAYYGLGELARLEGNYSQAIEHYCASLQAVHDGAQHIEFPRILDGIAKTETSRSNFAKAAHLFGASQALRNKISTIIQAVDFPDYDKHLELLKSKMKAIEFESAWAEGAKMSFEEVYQYVMQKDE
jgi:predicted ATPase/DNA-binding XRE family transcriptional regulator